MSQPVVLVAVLSVNELPDVWSPPVLGLAVTLRISEPFGPEKTMKAIAGPRNMARPPHMQSMFCKSLIALSGIPVVM